MLQVWTQLYTNDTVTLSIGLPYHTVTFLIGLPWNRVNTEIVFSGPWLTYTICERLNKIQVALKGLLATRRGKVL
jgi:hypothetical protein